MKPRMPRGLALLAVMVLILFASGCSKKATQAPPEPQKPPETPTEPSTKLEASDFQPAFFDFDSYALREDARTALDHNAKVLRDHADAHITIEGHCDERGTVEYNQALG